MTSARLFLAVLYMHYTLYVIPTCPFCKRAVQLLKKKNRACIVHDVTKLGGKEHVLTVLNVHKKHTTVPIIFGPDGKFIGGCDALTKHFGK